MKKINKKGFAITEILAVTIVIMVVFISVYKNFFPTTAEFERRMKYNDLESLYATYYMRQLFNKEFNESDFDGRTYNLVYNEDIKCNSSKNNEKCNKIAVSLGIKEMIITKNVLSDLKNKVNEVNVSDDLKNYIKYLPSHLTQTEQENQYRIILKTETGYATSLLNYTKPIKPNKPELTPNLLPIKVEDGKIYPISSDSDEWYDYDNGKWANAVTLKEDVRANYFDEYGNQLTDIDENASISIDNINTMWVWIPRYKYTIFNYNADGKKEANIQSIDIQFENGLETTGTVYCNDDLGNNTSEVCYYKDDNTNPSRVTPEGKYSVNNATKEIEGATYTHSAFCFGNRTINEETGIITCSGTELTGIWVGKYENSIDNENITVLPGKNMYLGQDITEYFTKIKSMEIYNNPYGFAQAEGAEYTTSSEMNDEPLIENDSNNLDTHMMKNSEWGAVSYLTLSNYGIYSKKNGGFEKDQGNNYKTTKNVALNSTTVTGNGGDVASTTNNETGIYDMAGGTSELVMGAIRTSIDNRLQLYYDGGSSTWTSSNSKNRLYLSNLKYYNIYITNNDGSNYKIGKLGDATKEVSWSNNNQSSGWFTNITRSMPIVGTNQPVVTRGGMYSDGSNANILTYNASSGHGGGTETIGSRAVLIIDPQGGNI